MHLWLAVRQTNLSDVWHHLRDRDKRFLKRDALFFLQRLVRGWDDSETWSLDHSLAKIIAPRLRRFRDITIGTPSCSDSKEEWIEELDHMVESFDFIASDEYFNCDDPEKLESAADGVQLFAERFGALWW